MEITRYDDPEKFRADIRDFLIGREAEHNLFFGITASLIEYPGSYESFYLAVVRDEGEIVAAVLRTPPYSLLLSHAPQDAIPVIADDVRGYFGALPGVTGSKETVLAFLPHWQRISGQAYHPGLSQRIYQLESVVPVNGVPGTIRAATAADRDLLVDWWLAFEQEAIGRSAGRTAVERGIDNALGEGARRLVVWDDNGPVSMAGATGPTPNGIRVGPVYTPPEIRGRGYASALTAALSQQLLDEGRRYCFLFTDLSNPTSNRIYQNIGYRPVVDVDEYRFDEPSSAP